MLKPASYIPGLLETKKIMVNIVLNGYGHAAY
jgi:hypothetical protein